MHEKVLLVDDEQDFLSVMAQRMGDREMDVITAASADEALQSIENESFDVVILDMMMPGMSGLETLKVLKNSNPDMQIIFLTGNATVEKGIEAMKLGAMDLVEKPADLIMLSEKIRRAHTDKMLSVEDNTLQEA